MLIGGSGTGSTTYNPQNTVNSSLSSSDFAATGSYYHLSGDSITYGWGALLPDNYDGELFDLQDFDAEQFMTYWDNLEQDYDYSYNIQSLYMALNTFRLNLTILQTFLHNQYQTRMIHTSINDLPEDTYVCWDYYSSLNPFGFCQWRGLFRQGPNTYSLFNDEIQA